MIALLFWFFIALLVLVICWKIGDLILGHFGAPPIFTTVWQLALLVVLLVVLYHLLAPLLGPPPRL